MDILPIKLELRKLGLTEKEVRVYLAGLKLGPNSVSNIAQVAEITRPTTYEIIKRLKKKSLFYEIKDGKKKYFVSQSPNKILGLLRTQKKEIEEKEREFVRIIAALETKYSKEETEIREYTGKKGIELLEETFSFTPLSEIFILSSDADLKSIQKRNKIYQKIKKRLGKIKVKEVYFKKTNTKQKAKYIQRKTLPELTFNGTLILSDKVIFLNYKKEKGFLTENLLIVDLLKSLFSILWKLS